MYQPYEDQLPYFEFSIRLPKASIRDIVPLLSEVSDEEYLQLRAGLAKHWRTFVWDKAVGGSAVRAAERPTAKSTAVTAQCMQQPMSGRFAHRREGGTYCMVAFTKQDQAQSQSG